MNLLQKQPDITIIPCSPNLENVINITKNKHSRSLCDLRASLRPSQKHVKDMNENNEDVIDLRHRKETLFLNHSFDQPPKRPHSFSALTVQRQESCPIDNDIGLERDRGMNQQYNRQRTLKRSRCVEKEDYYVFDYLDSKEKCSENDNCTAETTSEKNDMADINIVSNFQNIKLKKDVNCCKPDTPSANLTSATSSHTEPTHQAMNKYQRSITELIRKHLPAGRDGGEDCDPQLCHDIVSELKLMADTFDERNHNENPLHVWQQALNIKLEDLILPGWFRHNVGPAMLKTILYVAVHYADI